jgi:hypothetical protein
MTPSDELAGPARVVVEPEAFALMLEAANANLKALRGELTGLVARPLPPAVVTAFPELVRSLLDETRGLEVVFATFADALERALNGQKGR